tara:strand:+ start:149 stop:487 length:339 start_codon:yes stop_codon:yes gene_type:complete
MKKFGVERNGLTTETFHNDSDKAVIHERSIDVEPILKANKRLLTLNDGYSKSRELKRVATIPTLMLEIWCKEYLGNDDGNWFGLPRDIQNKILKTKLNDSNYKFLKTAEGKL